MNVCTVCLSEVLSTHILHHWEERKTGKQVSWCWNNWRSDSDFISPIKVQLVNRQAIAWCPDGRLTLLHSNALIGANCAYVLPPEQPIDNFHWHLIPSLNGLHVIPIISWCQRQTRTSVKDQRLTVPPLWVHSCGNCWSEVLWLKPS